MLPDGDEWNASWFRIAANNCCNSCILAWSRLDRFLLVLVLEILDQNPPRTCPIVVSVRAPGTPAVPQIVWSESDIPGNGNSPLPGGYSVPNHTAEVSALCVAQKP